MMNHLEMCVCVKLNHEYKGLWRLNLLTVLWPLVTFLLKKSPSLRRQRSFRICQPENREEFHQMHSLTFISLCVDNWDSVEQRTHFTLNEHYLCRRADLMTNMRERECLPSQSEYHRYDRGKQHFSSTQSNCLPVCRFFLQQNVSFWQTIPQLAGLKSVWPSTAWSTSSANATRADPQLSLMKCWNWGASRAV